MANNLNELTDPVLEQGREVNVINKQLPVQKSTSAIVIEVLLWICGIIPGLIFFVVKKKRESYLNQLEQKLQHDASTIDNYLEQRVVILQNCAKLLDKAIDLDKDTFEKIAKYRSGIGDDNERNNVSSQLDGIGKSINMAFERYPELRAHQEIADAMQQNSYLQREITAAREVYNDSVNTWNREIFQWPINQMIAAKNQYTTRIPFAASKEVKMQAREVMFN